jgi:hypothetical protein
LGSISTRDLINNQIQKMFRGMTLDTADPYLIDLAQQAPEVKAELQRRSQTGALRGDQFTQFFTELDKIDEEALSDINNIPNESSLSGLTPRQRERRMVDRYFDITAAAREQKRGVQRGQGIDFDEPDINNPDPNKAALARYNEIFTDDDVKDSEFGPFNSEVWNRKVTALLKSLEATPSARDYVIRNTNRREVPEFMLRMLRQNSPTTFSRIQRSRQARQRHASQFGIILPESTTPGTPAGIPARLPSRFGQPGRASPR